MPVHKYPLFCYILHNFEPLLPWAQNLKVKESVDFLPLQMQDGTKLHQLRFLKFQHQTVEIQVKFHYIMTFHPHKLVKSLQDKMPGLLNFHENLSKIMFDLV